MIAFSFTMSPLYWFFIYFFDVILYLSQSTYFQSQCSALLYSGYQEIDLQVGSVASSFKLLDGNEIQAIALGTSLGHLADGTRLLSVNHSVAGAVLWALEAGYRHVDTASLYRVEDEVGLGVRNYLALQNSRSEVYITTKLWIDSFEREDVPKALRRSLREMQLDYVDLYLMHYPFAYNKDGSVSFTDYLTTWNGMEDAKDLNLTRSIGVSNFNLTQMKRLWDYSRIKPTVLQIEVNPTITQIELVDWCHEKGIVVMGYTPFGAILGRQADAPPPRVQDPLLQALATKYRKSVPQILLRYLIDRNVIPIARSMNKERIEQSMKIFDFRLTDEDVQQMSRFNRNHRLRKNTYVKFYRHPNFPFEKKNVTDAEIQHAIDSIVEN